MPVVRPFRAWRPPVTVAASVAAPPYDVVSTAEARALAAGNALSFLHVSRPEIDLPAGTDEHAEEVYRQGRMALDRFKAEGVLVQDETARYTIYRQVMGDVVQTGVVGVVDVDDYATGRIKKHEFTRPDKEDDRTRHIDALDAHDEPVFLLHRRDDALAAVIARVTSLAPDVDFVADDGIEHTVWIVRDDHVATSVAEAFAAMGALYVADGHHRSAAAQRLRDARAAAGDRRPDLGRFLAVVFAEDELNVMAYNRVVTDLNGRSADAFVRELDRAFTLERSDAAVAPVQAHEFGIYLGGSWWRARLRPGIADERDPKRRLDVSVLQEFVLHPLLGIEDPRTDARIAFVGGVRGTGELERLVDSGEHAVAFSLCPTSVSDLMELADAGDVMPPKSTWFEPKLRSGLFVHVIDDADAV